MNYDFFFYYLEKEGIIIDKEEFLFQMKSHPDYPSLLAISDTLSFFNIENAAMHISESEIELLPNSFITLLSEENNVPQLYLITKKGQDHFYRKEKVTATISKEELKSRWQNIVFLVGKNEFERTKYINKYVWVLPVLCFVVFSLVMFQFRNDIESLLFFIFPALGFLFSIAALKNLFGAKSELISSFCNINASTSCDTILESKKWKIFEWVSYSDLSIVFFTSQFLGLFIFTLTKNLDDYFSIQTVLVFSSIPIILISLYFQKFVEKKWCPICLVIISIFVLEIFYLLLLKQSNFTVSTYSILLYLFELLFVFQIWVSIKKKLTKQKKLEEFQFKANRFMRNFEVFKNNLIAKKKVLFPEEIPIKLGNKKSKTIITIISSPFCGHCKEAHEILERILKKHSEVIQIQILLKGNLKEESKENIKIFRTLYKVYSYNDNDMFVKSLRDWFEKKKSKDWFDKYNVSDDSDYDYIIDSHYEWSELNGFNFTPAIFVNGYEYPELYERENLEYFINDLIEDSF